MAHGPKKASRKLQVRAVLNSSENSMRYGGRSKNYQSWPTSYPLKIRSLSIQI